MALLTLVFALFRKIQEAATSYWVAQLLEVAAITRDSAELVRLHTDQGGFVYEIGTNVTLARA